MNEPIHEQLSIVETWQATCSFRWYTRESYAWSPEVDYETVLQQAWISNTGNIRWFDVPHVDEDGA